MSSKNKTKKIDNLLSDSEDSDVQITKNSNKNDKNKKRKNSSVSDNSNSVNLLKNNNKRKQSKEKKVIKKKNDSDDEESSEEEKAKKSNGKAKINAKSKKHDEDSDEESSEEDKKNKNKGKKAGKAVKKAQDSDEDSDEEEKVSTKKAIKKPSAGRKSSIASKSSVASKKGKNAKKPADSDDESDNEVVIKNNKGGKNAEVEEDPNACRELFVKNLAFKATQDGLREHFSEYGNVINVKICTDKMTQKPRGFGYVEFEKRSDAQKVINEPGEVEGRPYLVAFSDEKEKLFGTQQGGQGQGGRSFGGGFKKEGFSGTAHTIFIGNLGYRTTEDKIKKFFNKCGNVVDVRIAKHEDGKAKGFCHVDFDSQDAVTAACELTGRDLDGRDIRVDAAEQKRGNRGDFGGAPRGGRGGGFRGGRGGGRPGIEKQYHAPMGSTGTKKTFNDDSD